MKTFYGGTFISEEELNEAKRRNPIKLEYYKIGNDFDQKEEYGLEIVKTEYTKEDVLVENKIIEKLTENEKIINKVLDIFKLNEVTPMVADEVLHDLCLKRMMKVINF